MKTLKYGHEKAKHYVYKSHQKIVSGISDQKIYLVEVALCRGSFSDEATGRVVGKQ